MGTVTIATGVDLWDLHRRGRWAVIPTNTQVRGDGSAVMGAGLARAAAERYPDLPARYGRALRNGHHRLVVGDHRLFLAPTKHHWRNPSTVELVGESLAAIRAQLDRRPVPLVVPAVGCGLGGLDWEVVEALIVEHLDGTDTVAIAPT
jgi:hypothetical protein